jgi:superoxide dismutase
LACSSVNAAIRSGAIDYGSAHAKYIDAFFANVNWAVLEKRWQAASK